MMTDTAIQVETTEIADTRAKGQNSPRACFHLAFPVGDIAGAKAFYGEGLGCEVGRETSASVILNLCGHQLVAHLNRDPIVSQKGIYPRHFGLIFDNLQDWERLQQRAQQRGLTFYQDPKWRFVETPLEHATFFLQDPFQNLLEFKFYRHSSAIFGEQDWKQIGDSLPQISDSPQQPD